MSKGKGTSQLVTSIRIDKELWQEAKIYSIKKGTTLTELIEKLLRQELEGNKNG